jgi:hypothetical protein
MAITWPTKDPGDTLDYAVDWTDRLAGDTIAASVWTLVVAAGLTKASEAHTDVLTTVWLSAGTAGLSATLKNVITTTGGRTMDEVISLAIDADLVVETGLGLVTADSLATVEQLEAYCAGRGIACVGTRQEKKAALRRATSNLNNGWAFKGGRTHGRKQGACWPRWGVTDKEGWAIQQDEIPIEIVQAVCELAAYELTNPGGLTPTVILADRIKRESIMGLTTEYVSTESAEANRPVLTAVNDLLGGFLSEDAGDGGSSIFGSTARV